MRLTSQRQLDSFSLLGHGREQCCDFSQSPLLTITKLGSDHICFISDQSPPKSNPYMICTPSHSVTAQRLFDTLHHVRTFLLAKQDCNVRQVSTNLTSFDRMLVRVSSLNISKLLFQQTHDIHYKPDLQTNQPWHQTTLINVMIMPSAGSRCHSKHVVTQPFIVFPFSTIFASVFATLCYKRILHLTTHNPQPAVRLLLRTYKHKRPPRLSLAIPDKSCSLLCRIVSQADS